MSEINDWIGSDDELNTQSVVVQSIQHDRLRVFQTRASRRNGLINLLVFQ